MTIENSSVALAGAFDNLWSGVIGFIPNLIIAIVIFVVGWIIASLVGSVICEVFKKAKVDSVLAKTGLDATLSKAGFVLDSGKFIGGLVKWFVAVAFLIASFDVLKLTQVNEFLKNVVVGYLPQVIAAVLILLVTAVIAEAVQKLVAGSAKAASVNAANFLGAASKWVIWIVGVLTALDQLGIGASILQTLFTGIVIALSIAFGLAFGLGGQEVAKDVLHRIKDEISSRK